MSKQIKDKMRFFKKVFIILLILDGIGLVQVGIALFPTFKKLTGYGGLMLGVAGAMIVAALAIMLFEIVAKAFLLRSTAPAFGWSSNRKSCVTIATLVLLFNLGSVIVNLLSAGGEGATLLNQTNLYLRMVSSVAEVVVVVCYLRTVKKLFKEINQES